jgi:hypothetical protein
MSLDHQGKWYTDKACDLWPHCSCAATMEHFQAALESERFTWEQGQSIAFGIAMSLHCAGAHCPDPVVKAYALRQLSNPFWDFSRENRDLEEGDFAKRRTQGSC